MQPLLILACAGIVEVKRRAAERSAYKGLERVFSLKFLCQQLSWRIFPGRWHWGWCWLGSAHVSVALPLSVSSGGIPHALVLPQEQLNGMGKYLSAFLVVAAFWAEMYGNAVLHALILQWAKLVGCDQCVSALLGLSALQWHAGGSCWYVYWILVAVYFWKPKPLYCLLHFICCGSAPFQWYSLTSISLYHMLLNHLSCLWSLHFSDM